MQKNGHLVIKVTQLQEHLQHARNALASTDRDVHQSNAETDRLRKQLAATGANDEPTESRAETIRLRNELATAASQKQLLESKLDFLNRDNQHLRSTNVELRAKIQEQEIKQTTPEQPTPKQPAAKQPTPEQLVPRQRTPKQRTPKQKTKASQSQSECASSSSAGSDYVECEDKLPTINLQRVLDLGGMLDDHRLAFRLSNKWYYAVTESHPLTRPRLTLLREDLQWHVDFMSELAEELSSVGEGFSLRRRWTARRCRSRRRALPLGSSPLLRPNSSS